MISQWKLLLILHENVPHGIGIFKDELAGWLKDMNKYRSGQILKPGYHRGAGQVLTLTG